MLNDQMDLKEAAFSLLNEIPTEKHILVLHLAELFQRCGTECVQTEGGSSTPLISNRRQKALSKNTFGNPRKISHYFLMIKCSLAHFTYNSVTTTVHC